MPVLLAVLRFGLAGVFVAASLPKLADPRAFALAVARYDLLPEAAVVPVAILVPWTELACALALLFRPSREAAANLLLTLLLAFTATSVVMLVRADGPVPCGCFSTAATHAPDPWAHLSRNAALLGLAGLVAWDAARRAPQSRAT